MSDRCCTPEMKFQRLRYSSVMRSVYFVLSYDIETEHRETDNDQVKSVFVLSYDIERSIERQTATKLNL